jgi:hypothetical protein
VIGGMGALFADIIEIPDDRASEAPVLLAEIKE